MIRDLTVNDDVRLKRTPGVWTVHEIHRPTVDHETTLVSLRPVGASKDKDCEGWPSYTYRTVRLDEVVTP